MKVAIAIALLLLSVTGCTQESVPAPSRTGYAWGTIVDQGAYQLLIKDIGYPESDSFMNTVCTSVLTVKEMDKAQPALVDTIHLAVLAGCPERRDWS